MIDVKLHHLIDEFVQHHTRIADLRGDYLWVCLRHSWRRLDYSGIKVGLTHCIDIANVHDTLVEYQLHGIFPAFIDHLESKQLPIYIENVYPEQLRWYFTRRGYITINSSDDLGQQMGLYSCFYKLPPGES